MVCAEITVQVTECEVVSCSEWRWFKLYEMRFELTWHQNPQTETCCSGSSVCSRCVWAGYTLCTVAFGTAVATTQGLYHMLARTKAQSGGALVKEEITPTPGSVYFTSKSTASFPKGLEQTFFKSWSTKWCWKRCPGEEKASMLGTGERVIVLYGFLLFFGLLINWKCFLSWSKLNRTQKYLYHSPGNFPLLLLLQPHVSPKYTNKSTFKTSPGYVCWGSQLSSPTPLP